MTDHDQKIAELRATLRTMATGMRPLPAQLAPFVEILPQVIEGCAVLNKLDIPISETGEEFLSAAMAMQIATKAFADALDKFADALK